MSYWRNRELEHIKELHRFDDQVARRIQRNYQRALEEIQEQIEAFYGRYADKEGISMSEARKRVAQLDIDKYARKAKKYVKERNFTPKANEEMRIYNVTMRINRLELLKRNIELELYGLFSDEERLLFDELTKLARREFEHQSGILGMTVRYNEKMLEDIVTASFLTATWSDRIWNNQNALRAELDVLINRGIVQGLNSRDLARELRKTIESSEFNSERLMRTEMARVRSDIFIETMDQAGFDEYEYIAEPTACPICAELDGEIFDKDKIEIGVNMPPLHPHCKCATANAMSREKWDAELKARGL